MRLHLNDWTGWLLGVITPNRKASGLVWANFRQVVSGGELRLYLLVTQLVEAEGWRSLGRGGHL